MTTPESPPAPRSSGRRAVVASMVGTTVEYYDFLVYGVAASLVFGKLFFPQVEPAAGVLLSLSTFAIAFLMRPIGAAVFGNLGDRIGRKRVLFVTMMLMGVGTVAIGLLPTYHRIGVLAPVLLVLCRLLQGLALGGEQAGGFLMSIESSSQKRRGLAGAFVNSGAGWGLLLANLLFLLLGRLPGDAFLSWGWRLPFLLSAVLVIVGLYIRFRLEESPEFVRVENARAVKRVPLFDAVKRGWKPMILVMLCCLGTHVNFYVVTVYSLTYGTGVLHQPKTTLLSILLILTAVYIFSTPFFGVLADRFGARRTFVVSAIALVLTPFAFYPLLGTGSYLPMVAGGLLLFLAVSANSAAEPTFFAHAFPASIRYSAMAVAYGVGAVIGGSFAPLISAALFTASGSWTTIALYNGGAALVSVVAGLLLREHRKSGQSAASVTGEPATQGV
ncbi:MFS transporter [Amycolatopsis australiensis]|uniref:Putative proline/betaine transporter n=1 Tax=Amycolatopsis australiensis TaxID=546364 RepID=A0A1K1SXU9_9PSEU|nr:MFS transporter [Amycolatopsis australiensis]SFW88685.1 Predicted arabinose efflux permease, MFS family [Amycolatopsis australiensis]